MRSGKLIYLVRGETGVLMWVGEEFKILYGTKKRSMFFLRGEKTN